MPLRATKDTFAYEIAGPGVAVRRKVIAGQMLPEGWFGDEAGTTPVDGAQDEPIVYGNTTPPPSHKYQIPVGEVKSVGATGVDPSSLPMSTTPPFDLTLTGYFEPTGTYEASIVSSDGQWTVGTPATPTDETTLVSTFPEAPDGEPGAGVVRVKDTGSAEFVGDEVSFTWESAEGGAEAEPEKKTVRARRRAPDE